MTLKLVENDTPKNELTVGEATLEDVSIEPNLRPKCLEEYIGQTKLVNNLRIFLKAALRRGEALDHVLLFGPPGLGKTSLSIIIANELGANLKTVSAPAVEKAGDLAAILTNLEEGDVLFIDEVHRLRPQVEEILYSAMEDYFLDILIGEGAAARSVRLELPKFTLVGATTRAGMISAPLRGRFGIMSRLDFYPPKELEIIAHRSAEILGVELEASGANELAKRSRGTPRIVNRLLRRIRDFAEVLADGKISGEVARHGLDKMEVDRFGLDEVDRKMLINIIEKFEGGPVGLGTISASINEEKDSIEEVIEPYLIQIGFINRTPRGRVITPAAYNHFGYQYQKDREDKPFAMAS